MKKIIAAGWMTLIGALATLSFTQVDLNLTLLNWRPYLDAQLGFTWLGYFNRPLNGLLFLLLFIGLMGGYLAIVKYAHAGQIAVSELHKLAILTSIVLVFSYSVFSHDIFNYIFDARIITQYGQNPYEHKALDYPQDEWIRFMQWTHRTYPYGPTWLLITIIPSFLGFAKLLPTYLLFKTVFVIAYNMMLVYLLKILSARKANEKVIANCFALLAFNPLIIIDGLVSSRIDIVMAATAMIAVYYHLKKSSALSYIWLSISGATKFATFGFIPLFMVGITKLKEEKFFIWLFIISALSSLGQIGLRGLQPWYFILPLVFMPLTYPYWRLKKILILTAMMLLPMSTYLYFIFTGISKDALWFLSS